MKDYQALSRRQVLGMAIAAGGLALSGAASSVFAQALKRTPGEILGPFYPVLRSVEKTADLTTLPGKPGRATGQVIYVMGRVLNHSGHRCRRPLSLQDDQARGVSGECQLDAAPSPSLRSDREDQPRDHTDVFPGRAVERQGSPPAEHPRKQGGPDREGAAPDIGYRA